MYVYVYIYMYVHSFSEEGVCVCISEEKVQEETEYVSQYVCVYLCACTHVIRCVTVKKKERRENEKNRESAREYACAWGGWGGRKGFMSMSMFTSMSMSNSCQLMPDTLLTDLSLHIHDSTLCQDILRCTNLGSLTEKRPRKVGYMLFIAGNLSVTPCVCIVYIVCPLCMYFSLVSAMCIFLLYITRWKVVSMAQSSHSKPLTLGAAHAARLCSEDALLDGASTSCSHCTCLYSVASSRGTHDGMSRFV